MHERTGAASPLCDGGPNSPRSFAKSLQAAGSAHARNPRIAGRSSAVARCSSQSEGRSRGSGARVRRRRHPHLISAAPTRGVTAALVGPEVLPRFQTRSPAVAGSTRGRRCQKPTGDTLRGTGSECSAWRRAEAHRLGLRAPPVLSQCAANGGQRSTNRMPRRTTVGRTTATPEVRIQSEGSREMAPFCYGCCRPAGLPSSRVTTRVSLERRSSRAHRLRTRQPHRAPAQSLERPVRRQDWTRSPA